MEIIMTELKAWGGLIIVISILVSGMFLSDLFTGAADKIHKKN